MMAILLRDKKEEPSVLSPLCCTKFDGSVRVTLNDSAAAYVAVWSSKAKETDSSLLECIKDNFRNLGGCLVTNVGLTMYPWDLCNELCRARRTSVVVADTINNVERPHSSRQNVVVTINDMSGARRWRTFVKAPPSWRTCVKEASSPPLKQKMVGGHPEKIVAFPT